MELDYIPIYTIQRSSISKHNLPLAHKAPYQERVRVHDLQQTGPATHGHLRASRVRGERDTLVRRTRRGVRPAQQHAGQLLARAHAHTQHDRLASGGDEVWHVERGAACGPSRAPQRAEGVALGGLHGRKRQRCDRAAAQLGEQ